MGNSIFLVSNNSTANALINDQTVLDSQKKNISLYNDKKETDAQSLNKKKSLEEILLNFIDDKEENYNKNPTVLSMLSKGNLKNGVNLLKNRHEEEVDYSPFRSNSARIYENEPDGNDKFIDIKEVIINTISEARKDYLDIFMNANAKMLEYIKMLNDLKEQLAIHIDKHDEHSVRIDKNWLMDKIKYIQEYINKNSSQLFPPTSGDKPASCNKTEAMKWLKQFGLSKDCLVEVGPGKYVVRLDATPLNTMLDSLIDMKSSSFNDWVILPILKYNLWQTGFDAQAESIHQTAQTMSQRLTHAQGAYDMLIKLLSSFIQQEAEICSSYLK